MVNPEEVHVWRADLDQGEDALGMLIGVLSEEELARASRFRFEKDRKRCAAARGILRHLVAQYLAVRPDELQFEYGPWGKPRLAGRWATSGLKFNLAHSQSYALFAAATHEVGVDLECLRNIPDLESISRNYFTPRECAAIVSLSPEVRHAAFFNCWTRKEAFVKATGEGLSYPLDQFEVSVSPNEPAEILWHVSEPVSRWAIYDVPVGKERAAALVIQGPPCRVVVRDWPPSDWRNN